MQPKERDRHRGYTNAQKQRNWVSKAQTQRINKCADTNELDKQGTDTEDTAKQGMDTVRPTDKR